jgi:hypothetical protein
MGFVEEEKKRNTESCSLKAMYRVATAQSRPVENSCEKAGTEDPNKRINSKTLIVNNLIPIDDVN